MTKYTQEMLLKTAKKYKYRSDFQKNSSKEYKAAYRRGILNEVCAHMEYKVKPNGYWTEKKLINEAKKYKSRSSFYKNNKSAYLAARRRALLDKVCSHMKYLQLPNGYWSKTRVLNEAKKYDTRSKFLKASSGAYASARKHNWLEEACKHMKVVGSRYKRAIYIYEFSDKSVYVGLTYDYEKRHLEHKNKNKYIGKKLKTTKYKHIKTNKWLTLDKIGKEEQRYIGKYIKNGWIILNRTKSGGLGSYPRKWDKAECKKVVSQYNDIKLFRTEQPVVYSVISQRGWLKELTKGMVRKHKSWKLREVHKIAKKYKSRKEFKNNNMAAYQAARRMSILDKVCKHMIRSSKPRNYWTKKRIFEVALKCKSRKEFSKKYGGAYNVALRKKWLDAVCKHMIPKVKKTGYWTKSRVLKEAKKFKTRNSFRKGSSSAYNAARNGDFLEVACKHMTFIQLPKGYWSKGKILKLAKKYKTYKEFRLSESAAYDYASRNKITSDIKVYFKKVS